MRSSNRNRPFSWTCPHGVCDGDGFEVFERASDLTGHRERFARDCRCKPARDRARQDHLTGSGHQRTGDWLDES